ncbi:MAG TPA: S26 family signal peptidase [Candidatus Poseidoniales archaeon]|nr:S26 family signal peptidase [Candidatus Poseidoniales archaeon]
MGRELLGAVALIVLLITGLALWTGTMPPLVVVESGSMMHSDSGEVGAIDPGDLVLLMDVDDQTVIHTYVEERMRSNPIEQHGKGGDVIIYDKNGAGGTPIIHRALLKVQAERSSVANSSNTCDGTWDPVHVTCILTWTIPGTDQVDVSSVNLTLPEVACVPVGHVMVSEPFLTIVDWTPSHEGYVTLGDNNDCRVDQRGVVVNVTGILDAEYAPVQIVRNEWLVGSAGPEIPWLGAVKLVTMSSGPGSSEVPNDSWLKLSASIAILFIITNITPLLRLIKDGDPICSVMDAWEEE